MTHRRPPANRRRQIILLITALTLALPGCGKSVDDKHEQIVKCAGFDSGFMAAGMAMGMAGLATANQQAADTTVTNAQSFMNTVQQTLQKDNIIVGSVIPADAVKQYTATMDPAKATRLETEGQNDLVALVKGNDANGAVAYYQSCLATFQDLGK